MRIPIAQIRRDFQPPECLVDETVEGIRSALIAGAPVPPVTVRYDGQHYWLQDGFHRVAAMESLGYRNVEVEIQPGDLSDIQRDFDEMVSALKAKLSEQS